MQLKIYVQTIHYSMLSASFLLITVSRNVSAKSARSLQVDYYMIRCQLFAYLRRLSDRHFQRQTRFK